MITDMKNRKEQRVNKKNDLGQGLDNLLSGVIGVTAKSETNNIDINKIKPNKSQPRTNFDSVEMAKIVESIKENGILQPIIVRPVSDGYEIVAGERRWRAASEIGLKVVPVIVKEIAEEKAMELALIENLQREDLNPIEKAVAYNSLMKNFELTQEEVAKRLSVDRSSVANIIRLLDLPQEVQDYVSRGTISMGHARAFLGIKDNDLLKKVCKRAIDEGLSVRQVEGAVNALKKQDLSEARSKIDKKKSPLIEDLEDQLRKSLKTKVSLNERAGRGKLVVEFYNNRQLENILSLLGVSFAD